MKQVIQSLKTGKIDVVDVPAPMCGRGQLRIVTSRSLISAGTERMMLDFGRGNLVQKARQQPDKVRMVLEKAKTDGIAATIETVRNKLDQPLAPGYCNVGIVDTVGADVAGFTIGDRVASNGKHAELVAVPVNLCAKIPDAVSDEDAVFTVVGAIALQGIRLAAPTLGESVAVIGLGLIGQLAVQLLIANGCRVIGFDFDPERVALARSFGADAVQVGEGSDSVSAALSFSRGNGVDAVLITAATQSDGPMTDAARMSRKRGRIVLVGVAGLNLSRADFFEKELSFQVSCSYGPGRYDPEYEDKGRDYPLGYVRWTEQRNFAAVLDMMAAGKIDCAPLRTHGFDLDQAAEAYEIVGGAEPSLGVVLSYPRPAEHRLATETVVASSPVPSIDRVGAGVINVIGAGSYASAVLVPAFARAGANLNAIGSSGGLSARQLAEKHGFAKAGSDTDALIADGAADSVVIATRHDSHARLTLQALEAGKNVFVEKPLAMTYDELDAIEAFFAGRPDAPLLTVGFNRRFAPLVQTMRGILARFPQPKAMTMTVNAGAIPPDHWTQDAEVGGGRIIGEACHFVDLLRCLAGAPIVEAKATGMAGAVADTATLSVRFADGSIGTVHYFANGNKGLPKERLEVFVGGGVLQLDNFRKLKGFGMPKSASKSSLRQDKGQAACAARFVAAVRGEAGWPIPLDELIEVSRTTIDLAAQLR
ncbi:bi-domain-containing oxidoreductase [Tsuneonella troitsensis]|uniref:bi-domain-containing oxidoreductase n=1 Tax=Tsuneonella troitsensis TaxID=292222 RepID=UPI000709F302|nr:bi-domain-containing oxidoreductase [Tsuneonella troitsensis]